MKIILSAFSCDPTRGSEPGVGWNWLVELSKNNKIFCFFCSWENQKEKLEEAIKRLPQKDNIYLLPLSIPILFSKIFYRVYYEIWQIKAYFRAEELIKKEKIDLIHHVTIATWWNCGYLWKLNIPFFLGPVSGGQKAPFVAFTFLPFKTRVYEVFRLIMIKVLLTSRKSYKNAFINSKVIFTANEETKNLLKPIRGEKPVIILNEVGVNHLPELNFAKEHSIYNPKFSKY